VQVRVGDMVRVDYRRECHFFGFVLEVKESPFALQGTLVATLWRPELPPSQQIQTWPLEAHYHIEVVQ